MRSEVSQKCENPLIRLADRTDGKCPDRATIPRRNRNRSDRCKAQHKIALATPANVVTRTELGLAEFCSESACEKNDAREQNRYSAPALKHGRAPILPDAAMR